MLETLHSFAASFPGWLQWLAVALVAAIPFVESHFGALIGVAIGLPPTIAVIAAIVGNTASVLVFLLAGTGARRITRGRGPATTSPRQEKLRRLFQRFGVPGVSLIGQMVIPNQFSTAAMVTFGAPRRTVALWQVAGITLWAVVFVALGMLGLNLLAGH